ncbi:hypothetical protein R5R04_003702 [Klebsiella aerogenes]|nr:hypothetical protein [Klebsiella aerogenes]
MQQARAFQTPPYAFHLNECTWQECSFRCGFPDASWFGCGGYQGDDGNADAQHHNQITPQDRDAVPETLLCVDLAVAVIPFLTTALFTAGRHHDDFML